MKNQVCGQTNCKFIFRSRKPLNSLHRSFTVKMSDHSTFFSHTHKNAPEYKAFGGREIFRSPKNRNYPWVKLNISPFHSGRSILDVIWSMIAWAWLTSKPVSIIPRFPFPKPRPKNGALGTSSH